MEVCAISHSKLWFAKVNCCNMLKHCKTAIDKTFGLHYKLCQNNLYCAKTINQHSLARWKCSVSIKVSIAFDCFLVMLRIIISKVNGNLKKLGPKRFSKLIKY